MSLDLTSISSPSSAMLSSSVWSKSSQRVPAFRAAASRTSDLDSGRVPAGERSRASIPNLLTATRLSVAHTLRAWLVRPGAWRSRLWGEHHLEQLGHDIVQPHDHRPGRE